MFQGLQRIRGAIDARIAEEQARQKASQPTTPSRSNSAPRRSSSRNLSPSQRPARSKDDRAAPAGKGPDPSEFDPEFVVGEEDDQPSRVSTPRPIEKVLPLESSAEHGDEQKGGEPSEEAGEQTEKAPEIPPEIQTRLRKLDKLEPKYSGKSRTAHLMYRANTSSELLRSYRIAHARIGTIEAFESSLREYTPLTSISDTAAFVEYLGQLNVKGDMLMEELKRVSKERDELNKKLDDAERRAKEATKEVETLKSAASKVADDDTTTLAESVAPSTVNESKQGDSTAETEDFFSYDSELPRLQSQLQESEHKVEQLEEENKSLKSELSTAQDSAESFMKNLETTTNDLNSFRDTHQQIQKEAAEREIVLNSAVSDLKTKLETAEQNLHKHKDDHDRDERIIAELNEKLEKSVQELEELHAEKGEKIVEDDRVQELEGQVKKLEADLSQLRETHAKGEKRHETMNGLLSNLREQLKATESQRGSAAAELEQTKKDLEAAIKERTAPQPVPPAQPDIAVSQGTGTASSKKNNKRNKNKKKGGKGTDAGGTATPEATPSEAGDVYGLLSPRDAEFSPAQLEEAQKSVADLKLELEEKMRAIHELQEEVSAKALSMDALKKKLKDQDDLQEEIETLRQDLLDFGLEHTEAKDKVNELQVQKVALQESLSGLEKEIAELKAGQATHESSKQEKESLTAAFQELKLKTDTLQTDLTVAEKLAASRFKDLTDMREILQKAHPELTSLRKEVAELRTTKEELAARSTDVRRLEGREKDLKSEIAIYRSQLSDKEGDIKTLNEKIKQETTQRLALEETNRKIQRDLQSSETDRKDVIEVRDSLKKDLAKAQDEVKASRGKIRDLEEEATKLRRDTEGLRDDIQLKSAQYSSAQDLMNSMQDQTQEMSTQMKEVRAKSESLEEELADAHRLLSERSREAETMRRLLNDAQGRADARVREMQERLDLAVEERERAEEQASSFGRRRARELEELKQKVRDAERAQARAVEDRDEVAQAEKEMRRQKEEFEKQAAKANEEAVEVRSAMAQLRDALEESEKQAREVEKEKSDLRRAFDETQSRLEKVQKASKTMSEELRSLKMRGVDSNGQSSRTSVESSRSRLGSPAPKAGTAADAIDYVYLKNVLLQFLEQRDKKYQQQLIPVLGMLLHFDKKDEQKWMAAVSAK